MKDELFQELVASLKEGGAILRGKKKPTRKTTLHSGPKPAPSAKNSA